MRLAIILMTLGSLAVPARAIVVGQVDDFQDGTTQGWGGYAVPNNVSTGGPSGSGDNYLKLTSNITQGSAGELRAGTDILHHWAGNYIAAGVNAVSMDFLNLGSVELDMRLLIAGNQGDFTSTVPFVVPPDGQWHHAVFGLSDSDMIWGGLQAPNDHNLTNALQLMSGLTIRHQSGPPIGIGGGTRITSSVGIDNIQALPEPGMLATGITLAGVLFLQRKRICSYQAL